MSRVVDQYRKACDYLAGGSHGFHPGKQGRWAIPC